MQAEIITWLESPTRDYQEGVRLLARYGRNRALAQHLQRKETKDNWNKLDYELRKHLESDTVLSQLEKQGHVIPAGTTVIIMQMPAAAPPAAADVATPPAEPPAPAADGSLAAFADKLSEEVQRRIEELILEGGQLHTQQAQLSNTLADQTSDAARLSVVQQIDAIKEKREGLAIERKRLEAGGPLVVEQPATPVLSLSELLTKRNNLRTQVSKARKEVEKATDPEKKETKQQRLDKLQLQLQAAEVQVKAAQAQQITQNQEG